MKKIYLILIVLLLTANLFAQAPQKMSYQAVIRDASSVLITSTTVGMQISILQGSSTGTPVYVEIQTPTSNANGLVSLEIGTGTIVTGTFSVIDWSAGPYFIKTETDPLGGTVYSISGTSELLSVPYALHAKTAESITGGITETDPIFIISPANGISTSDITNWNNKLDVEVDGSISNEIQALSISNDTVYLSNGGFVKLPAGFNGQYSSLTGAPANVSAFANDAGYLTSFTEVDASITNEIQALSISNDTVYLSNGGFVKLPSSNAWLLTGNSGTVGGTNFIGTTDNTKFNFRVNNVAAGGIDHINYNAFFGQQSGLSNLGGQFNSGFGHGTLGLNINGNYNSAFGAYSLYNNSSGMHNTAIGKAALLTNSTGSENTAIGLQSMYFNTTGSLNTAVGYDALLYNTTGNYNVAIGTKSGENNTGSANVFIGYQAGFNETGSNKLYIANNAANPPLIYGNFATGNVGIGTTTPNVRFQVYGNSGNLLKLQTSNIMNTAGQSIGLTFATSADTETGRIEAITESNGNIGMRFYTYAAGLNERLRISSTGNIGIGTTTPSTKLEVNGQIKITGGTPGAGKVLTSDATGLASWQALPIHYIGENYGGGIVFYVYDNGQHGLIASPVDQSVGIQWYNGTNKYTGTTGDGLGAGTMNSTILVASQMADNPTGNFAAKLCADYSVTVSGVTYGDWYLPSIYELNLLYLQQAVVGGLANDPYWSSTETDNVTAWSQNLTTGTQYSFYGKGALWYVRAIRTF